MKAPGICSTDDPLARMLIDGSGAPSPGDGPQGRRENETDVSRRAERPASIVSAS